MDRRSFLQWSIAAAAALGAVGLPRPARGQTAPGQADATVDALVESLAHDPMSLQLLDVLGTVNFADAMGGIAVQGDSVIQKLLVKSGLGRLPDQVAAGGDHRRHVFPLPNFIFAAVLNAVRSTAFGPQVRDQTIHELETTAVGVAMLMGLTSVAKGIISSEATAIQMLGHDPGSGRGDPQDVIVDNIFQLTLISAATQIPLSSFGNAAIGNEGFREVRAAFNTLYAELLPPLSGDGGAPREAIVMHIREKLTRSDNPVIRRQVTTLLDDAGLETHGDFAAALQGAATWHTHDLMTILMSTACDDSQAALGDPGPLVGLYQNYGIEFLQAIPSLLPYTILIGFERALWAMNRTGIPRPAFTKARFVYMTQFLKETWRNLVVYFATVAPELSSKITGSRRVTGAKPPEDSVGVSFSVLEQVLKDIESIITAFMDPFMSDQVLDERKTRKAVADLQDAVRQWHETLGRRVAGRLFPARTGSEHGASVARAEALADQAATVGEKESRGAPYAYKKDELPQSLKDLQIRLAAIVNEAGIEQFAAEVRRVRRTIGPQLQREIEAELARQGAKPTVMTALEVMRKNPRVRELLDINYWHERIGPALTDTMFIVLLQGLHLPFLLSTSERYMYDAPWFRGMPLTTREILSVLYNNALGLFADNWADCVAHGKWLTNMYLSELAAQLDEVSGEFTEVTTALASGYFVDDETVIIPLRFKANAEQASALFDVLQNRYAGETARLEAARQRYLHTAETYYFKSMIIAMTISVVGAGKSLPGDSTHFTFAAGETDFTLAVTLLDFKRHPLYHVWELIFSGAYAMVAGPFLAQRVVAPAFSRLGIGSGALETIRGMMQEEFRKQYPGMAERFQQLAEEL
jgi:hypothetical protein